MEGHKNGMGPGKWLLMKVLRPNKVSNIENEMGKCKALRPNKVSNIENEMGKCKASRKGVAYSSLGHCTF